MSRRKADCKRCIDEAKDKTRDRYRSHDMCGYMQADAACHRFVHLGLGVARVYICVAQR